MLRRTALALALTAGLIYSPLAACQSLPTSTPTTETISLRAEQALYIAELAYNGFTVGAEAALNSGALSAVQRAQVRAIDQHAYQALTLARQGRATASSVLTVVAEAQGLLSTYTTTQHH